MKKVIVRLANGLGNQLFTYAAAYSFAQKNNAQLFVDNESGFYKRSKYELNNFNITASVADNEHKFIGPIGRLKRKIFIKMSKFNKNKKFLIEKKDENKFTHYDENQLKIEFNRNLYLEGYFQSEKYFKTYEKNILKEFEFKNNIIKQKNKFVDEIINSNAVSIHIRKDKFLINEKHKNLKKLNEENTKINIETCRKGINFFNKEIDNPKFFIWSNNFEGLRNIFDEKKFTFVDENLNKDPAYDLYLMSLCKHFILSPSTMHYWAAYLSKNKKKICIAPKNLVTKSGYYAFSNNKDIKPTWWKDI
jgi:hypothetical protein